MTYEPNFTQPALILSNGESFRDVNREAIKSLASAYRVRSSNPLREQRSSVLVPQFDSPQSSLATPAQPVEVTLGEGEGEGSTRNPSRADTIPRRSTPLTANEYQYGGIQRVGTRGEDERYTPQIMPRRTSSKVAERLARRKLKMG